MRWLKVAIATIVALCTYACGEGTPPATAPGAAAAARRGNSTIGMFLSRSSAMSSNDRSTLTSACGADVKKSCPTLSSSSNGYESQAVNCLRDHDRDLSKQCHDAIQKMRHDKDADDACAGACVCPQNCVADDDDHGDKDKGKDKSGGSGKGSLTVARARTSSHDASHDGDHDDDDLRCEGPCPAGLTACDGRCVDLRSDPDNCGRCDNECEDDYTHKGQVCSAGTCAAKCATGFTDCSGACVDEQTDPSNCGVCGLVCGCGQVCSGGICVAPGVCTRDGAACAVDAQCCPGSVCLPDPVLGRACGIPG
jgi:hypothetical protein